MRYKTVIKIDCDGFDEDDASYTAGEYLRGNVDMGVHMSCSTMSTGEYLVRKYGMLSLTIAVLAFGILA